MFIKSAMPTSTNQSPSSIVGNEFWNITVIHGSLVLQSYHFPLGRTSGTVTVICHTLVLPRFFYLGKDQWNCYCEQSKADLLGSRPGGPGYFMQGRQDNYGSYGPCFDGSTVLAETKVQVYMELRETGRFRNCSEESKQ